MFEIKGKYTKATIMTDNVEETAIAQITELVNNPDFEDNKVVIMPDVHAGAGCTIGTTIVFKDKVVPNLVGVDIGCMVSAHRILGNPDIDLERLDKIIHERVPSGRSVHDYETTLDIGLEELKTPLTDKQKSWAKRSLGTLGGGNHFISIERDEQFTYLLVHTGSRNLGKLIAEYHQNVAKQLQKQKLMEERNHIVRYYTSNNKEYLLEQALKDLKAESNQNSDLASLSGVNLENYLDDVHIAQQFAKANHTTISETIFKAMGWEKDLSIYTQHNYIDLNRNIIRKGSIDATAPLFLVPLNMRDGTLIFYGDVRPDWNYSAPHGAGRVMSRSEAKKTLDLDVFHDDMKNIYTSSVGQDTLDESPRAYKSAEEINNALTGVYRLVTHLKPIYNFKASE